MSLAAMLLNLLLAQIGAVSEGPLIETAQAPTTPWNAAEGGVVIAELTVKANGVVEGIQPLRTTPPYDVEVMRAVSHWTFRPLATAERNGVSHFLVVAVFRPNTLLGAPMAQATDTARPTGDVAFPKVTPPPPYPVNAVGADTVVLEVQVDAGGRAADVRLLSGSPPFAAVSEATARKWTFRPARVGGTTGGSRAYIIFSFREPITVPTATSPHVVTGAP